MLHSGKGRSGLIRHRRVNSRSCTGALRRKYMVYMALKGCFDVNCAILCLPTSRNSNAIEKAMKQNQDEVKRVIAFKVAGKPELGNTAP